MFTEYCQACGNPTTSAARPKFCGNCGNPFTSLASLVGATKPQTVTTSAVPKKRVVYVDEVEEEEVIKVIRKKPRVTKNEEFDDDEEGGGEEITEVPMVNSLQAEVKSSPVRKVMGEQIVGTSKSGRGSDRRERPGKKYKLKDFQSEAGSSRQK